MLNVLRRSAERRKAAGNLSLAIATQARAPEFFCDLMVPDSFNGRFDMVALHGWLALERLEAQGARGVAQQLVNALFDSFENALRDQGAGDVGMSRRITKIASAFYGRLAAYKEAESREALSAAILRNVYGDDPACAGAADRLADYALAARARLAGEEIASGRLEFGPVASHIEPGTP